MMELLNQCGADKRAESRIRVYWLSDVGITVESRFLGFCRPGRECRGVLQNVSLSGCQVLLDHCVPVGSVVRLLVQVQDGSDVRCLRLRGDVAWSASASQAGQYLMGISLRPRPAANMHIWGESVTQRMRRSA